MERNDEVPHLRRPHQRNIRARRQRLANAAVAETKMATLPHHLRCQLDVSKFRNLMRTASWNTAIELTPLGVHADVVEESDGGNCGCCCFRHGARFIRFIADSLFRRRRPRNRSVSKQTQTLPDNSHNYTFKMINHPGPPVPFVVNPEENSHEVLCAKLAERYRNHPINNANIENENRLGAQVPAEEPQTIVDLQTTTFGGTCYRTSEDSNLLVMDVQYLIGVIALNSGWNRVHENWLPMQLRNLAPDALFTLESDRFWEDIAFIVRAYQLRWNPENTEPIIVPGAPFDPDDPLYREIDHDRTTAFRGATDAGQRFRDCIDEMHYELNNVPPED